MRKLFLFISLLIGVHSMNAQSNRTFTVRGVSFTMIYVPDEYNGDFYLGQTEVTQELWKAVMGNNPSSTKGDRLPVNNVSWYDCQEFTRKLNNLTGKRFSLPFSASYYTAIKVHNSNDYKYPGSNSINEVAWWLGNSNWTLHNVATKKPNELGIYDLVGNVSEWCLETDLLDPYDMGRNLRKTLFTNYTSSLGDCSISIHISLLDMKGKYEPESRLPSLGLRLFLRE